VVATHVDVSGAMQAAGRKTTEITAGKYKRIASSYAPLSGEGRDTLQDQVDYIYSAFVADVAAGRAQPVQTVLDRMADGRVFVGKQAVSAGLADAVSYFGEVLADLRSSTRGG
jgi:ClpP class serine protease